MTQTYQCPHCSGKGTSVLLVDYAPGSGRKSGLEERACVTCNGAGTIDHRRAQRILDGHLFHQRRVARREGLLDCANRLGTTPVAVSNYERGEV